jgi:hypothetical protein
MEYHWMQTMTIKNNFQQLYAKGKEEGKILTWEIWSEGNEIFMAHGVLGGAMTMEREVVPHGLASRTLEEQILTRINSRTNKKKDAGYVDNILDAEREDRTNALGYKRPAKCKAFNEKSGIVKFPGYVGIQKKFNGHHACVINDGGNLVMYSSNGKIIDTLPELLEGMKIPLGATIEGELYHHGTPLQTISSWVKRRQEDSDKIEFLIYDTDFYPDGKIDYMERYEFLKSIELNPRCKIDETVFVCGEFDVEPLLENSIENGYEGLVLRLEGYGHESGVRSSGLIKVKPRHFENFRVDDEFLVIDILPSVDGWARLKCETEEGKKFLVSCHGDMSYKTHVMENKDHFIGKHIRIEFESYTKDKIPFHPIASEWREKYDE